MGTVTKESEPKEDNVCTMDSKATHTPGIL